MRVKLLIATVDTEYADLISDYISEHHADIIEVSVCSTPEGLNDAVPKRKYDVALIDTMLIENAETNAIHLPMLLWSEHDNALKTAMELSKINKYQRVSKIVAIVLEEYAKVSGNRYGSDKRSTNITAVWSPAGGVGKTTVALAYAASCALKEKEVFYLNLETFSSIPGYFPENSKSISTVFEMLENPEGNVKMLIQGTCCRESGITYLCSPDNYDDMCILSADNVKELVTSCAQLTDELVIDLSCLCDFRTRQVFDIADKVLIVTESTSSSTAKLAQFTSQNNVFESIREKAILVANKGAVISENAAGALISLPLVQSNSTEEIYKALSENSFKS